jgi:hypothetical protein
MINCRVNENQESFHDETLYAALGHIRGRVADIDGCDIGGCKVWIRENGRSAYSDGSGNFTMINIKPALYTLVVECEGFSPFVIADLPIEPGDNPGHVFTIHSLVPVGKSRRLNSQDAMTIPMCCPQAEF